MPKTVKELVGEAVKSALEDELKSMRDRLDKVDPPDGGNGGAGQSGDTNKDGQAGGTQGGAGGTNNDDEKNKTETGDAEGVAEAVKSAVSEALKPVVERLDTVEKRTRPGSQQDDGSVPPSMKNDAEYDAFGRRIKLED